MTRAKRPCFRSYTRKVVCAGGVSLKVQRVLNHTSGIQLAEAKGPYRSLVVTRFMSDGGYKVV